MAASLIRTAGRTALRSGASAAPRAAASLTFARGKATLPDLSCMLASPYHCIPRLKLGAFFLMQSPIPTLCPSYTISPVTYNY
jgi:hypothetical protein